MTASSVFPSKQRPQKPVDAIPLIIFMPVGYTQMELKTQKEKHQQQKTQDDYTNISVTKNSGLFSSKWWLFIFKAPLLEQML